MGTGVDLGGYGIEGGIDVADAVVGLEILYGLGVVSGVVVAAESGLTSAGDLATIQGGTDDPYLGYRVPMAELLEVVERQGH